MNTIRLAIKKQVKHVRHHHPNEWEPIPKLEIVEVRPGLIACINMIEALKVLEGNKHIEALDVQIVNHCDVGIGHQISDSENTLIEAVNNQSLKVFGLTGGAWDNNFHMIGGVTMRVTKPSPNSDVRVEFIIGVHSKDTKGKEWVYNDSIVTTEATKSIKVLVAAPDKNKEDIRRIFLSSIGKTKDWELYSQSIH